jgi:carboxylesterase type B
MNLPSLNAPKAKKQHGGICLQTATTVDGGHSEDCLFLEVYAPSDALTRSTLLPVYFWIPGGGFNSLSGANAMNGSNLITASGKNIVIVTINYRVSMYGFLASKEVQKNGDTNAGLLDQRKALQWVQKYISKVRRREEGDVSNSNEE